MRGGSGSVSASDSGSVSVSDSGSVSVSDGVSAKRKKGTVPNMVRAITPRGSTGAQGQKKVPDPLFLPRELSVLDSVGDVGVGA